MTYRKLPKDKVIITAFNCTGVGAAQTTMATVGMTLGGCVRVGLEIRVGNGLNDHPLPTERLVPAR